MKTKLALFLVATLSASIHAQVLPNEAVVDGKTIGEWSAAWWQWLFTIPTNQNPVFDQDGSRAQVAQPGGDVFFLCGVLNISGQATRTITVPEDEYLFFAIVANEWDNIDTVPPYTVEQLRDLAAAATALTTELRASIDGVPVQDLFTHRAMSPVFSVDFQSPDNLQTFAYGHPIVGLVDPIVLDGYWLMVAPLGAGPHVINFGAILGPPVNFTLDITYNISVLPIPLPQRVAGLVEELERSNLPANRRQPLLVSLNAAKDSFESINVITGINQLQAFQNKVRAQVSPSDPALAEELSQAAQKIIDKATSQLNQPQTQK